MASLRSASADARRRGVSLDDALQTRAPAIDAARRAVKDLAGAIERSGVERPTTSLRLLASHLKVKGDRRVFLVPTLLRAARAEVAGAAEALRSDLDERATARLLTWEAERERGERDEWTLAELAASLGTTRSELLGTRAKGRAVRSAAGRASAGDLDRLAAGGAVLHRHPVFAFALQAIRRRRRASR